MKDKIIEILKNNEVTITDEYGGSGKAVLTDYYNDVADEIVKLLATPAVSKSEGIEREATICDHHWLGVGDWDGYAMEQCTKCNLFREAN